MSSKLECFEGMYLSKSVGSGGSGLGGMGRFIGSSGGWEAARTEADEVGLILNGKVLACFLNHPKLQKVRYDISVWQGPVGEFKGIKSLVSWCWDEDKQVVEAVTVAHLPDLEGDLTFLVKIGANQGKVSEGWLRWGPILIVETLEWGNVDITAC